MSDMILTSEEICSAVVPLLKKYKAEKAILFGSYGRSETDGHSDITPLIIGGYFVPTDVFCIADKLFSRMEYKSYNVYQQAVVFLELAAPILWPDYCLTTIFRNQ